MDDEKASHGSYDRLCEQITKSIDQEAGYKYVQVGNCTHFFYLA